MENIIIEQGEISAYAEYELLLSRLNPKDEENRKYNLGIHSLKFNYNDQYIAAGYQNGIVRLFNIMTKNLTCELDCNLTPNPSVVQNVKWRPKIEGRTNNILMAICGGSMLEWHTPSSKLYLEQGKS
jgi:WD40 repeat protein